LLFFVGGKDVSANLSDRVREPGGVLLDRFFSR
jgi:hypothetical protein